MAELFGKKRTKEELTRKTGNLSQICGFKEYTYNSGMAKGVDAIDVDAGELKFTVFTSRCLDIGQAYYKGIPFGYVSKSCLRNPGYFVENGKKGFLESFYGGLLTTSGLNNIGTECIVDGREYGLHGEIANIPAENVNKHMYWENNELYFEISGEVRHSRFYAENLVLERKIRTSLGSNKLSIVDTVENRDFTSVPLMLLYHINLGFPFLDAGSRLVMPGLKESRPRTASAKKGLKALDSFTDPIDGIEEECYYHTFKQETATICLFNPQLGGNGMGIYLRYDTKQLPVFLQWKMMRSREYICGFAPATNYAEGRKKAIEEGEINYIEPFEKKVFCIELGVTERIDTLLEK